MSITGRELRAEIARLTEENERLTEELRLTKLAWTEDANGFMEQIERLRTPDGEP